MMLYGYRSILAFAVPVLAIALGACGGGNDNSTTSPTSAATTGGGGAVSVQSISGVGDVLVDSQGDALYTNDQDSGSTIACTGECTSIWVPVAAPSSGQPSSDDSSVESKLGVVKRPDGTSQVSFDGKPLYSFVQDSAGQATGDGVSDSFGGTSFTWTVASSGGSASSGTGSSTSTSSGGGGYGY